MIDRRACTRHRPKVGVCLRRMTYGQVPRIAGGPEESVRGRDRSDREDRPAPQTFRRRAVPEDQLPDRATEARVTGLEELRPAHEPAAGQDHHDRRIGDQVQRPPTVGRAGGDEDAALRVRDEPHRDGSRSAGRPTAGRQPDEAVVVGKGRVERRRSFRASRGTAA
jgi:hypothetical protein